jgi:hypothetical protein
MKSPRDILARIESLVARASSPEQEESRTAALLAVALMRQYGVRLSLGDDHVVASAAPSPKSETGPEPKSGPPNPPPPPKSQQRVSTPRPTSIKPTVFVHRCSGCGRVVGRPGLCIVCVAARAEVGIWNVVCESCGRQAPGTRTVEKAHEVAETLGYEVTQDDRTLCPECLAREIPWQRAVR